MADTKEYLIKLRGDPTDLIKAVKEANASYERLADHEFKIKFNQKGAETEIKALLKLLSKQDIQVDIDANLANKKDIEDQLKLIQDVGISEGAKKDADKLRRIYEDVYKDISDTQDKWMDAQYERESRKPGTTLWEIAREREEIAREEYYRQLRRGGYLNALTSGMSSVPKEIADKIKRQQDAIDREIKSGTLKEEDDWRRVTYADDYKYNPQDIKKASREELKSRLAIADETDRELQKKLRRAKNNPEKFQYRGKDADSIVDEITKEEKLRQQRNAERESVIAKNQKAREGKDVFVENEKLLKEQERLAKEQSRLPEQDYSSMFDQGTDSAERFVQELGKVDEGLSEMKSQMKENQALSNLADEIMSEDDISSLKKRRQKAQQELGELYQRKVTRRDIEDDKLYKVTGYKNKKNGEVETVDYGKYYGKEIKSNVLPQGYAYDKRFGMWFSKGGSKSFDIEPEDGKDRLKKWQKRVQDKQTEIQQLDDQIKEVEANSNKKSIEETKKRLDAEVQREADARKRAVQAEEDARLEDYYKENRPQKEEEPDLFAGQYEKVTEEERQFTTALNEEAEASERAALARKNLESQKSVDDALAKQAKKQAEELEKQRQKESAALYESKGSAGTSDEYDSYYDNGVMERYAEQVEEARKAREKLNESMREGQSQADSTAEHIENLEKDTQAAKKNAEANEEATAARGKVASGDAKGATSAQDAYKRRGAEANVADEEMSAEDILKRTESIKEEGEKIKANAKEYEEDVIQAVSYYDSADNLVKIQLKTRKMVPNAEGSNKGQIETRTYTTNFDQESGASYTSHITDVKFVDNIQKQAKAQKILTQNIDESSAALERFIAEQKKLGVSLDEKKIKNLRDGIGKIYDPQDLTIWKKEFKAYKQKIADAQKADKRTKAQQESDAELDNKNAVRLKNLNEFNEQVQKSSAVTDEFKAKVKELYSTLSSAGKSPTLLKDFDDQLKKYQNDFKKIQKQSEQDNKSANKRLSTYSDRLDSYDTNKYTESVRQKISDLKSDLNVLRSSDGKFNIDLNSEEVANEVDRIDAEMKELKHTVDDTSNVLAGGISISKLNDQMAQFVNKNHKLTEKYKQDIRELREELETVGLTKTGFTNLETGEYVRGFDDILKDFKKVQTQAADEGLVGGVGAIENLGNRIKQMSTNFVAQYFSLYDIVRYARELGQTVTEINSAQTELRKVSDASQTRIQENFKKSADTAQEMGATISDVIASTSDWARLGYSVDDAEVLARNTALYQSVGDNMTQESASEYLTSIMKGYQLDADKSESIIDKVNEVAVTN